MHYIREDFLNIIRKEEFDYLLMIDSDIIFNGKMVSDSIDILKNNNYDAVTSNTITHNIPWYYDIFSLSTKNKKSFKINVITDKQLRNFYFDTFKKENEHMSVKSAFGGFFLTSSKIIKNEKLSYIKGNKDINKHLCEHKYFNNHIKNIKFICNINPLWTSYEGKLRVKDLQKNYNIVKENNSDNRNFKRIILNEISFYIICGLLFLIAFKKLPKFRKRLVVFFSVLLFFTIYINIINIDIENFAADKHFGTLSKENFNFLWSKGLEKKDDYALKETSKTSSKKEIINQMKNKEVIWIRSCDLDKFANLTNYLDNEVILVSGDGDLSIPNELKENSAKKILECSKIKKWLTQNYDGSIEHPKLKTYPIGFDLHTSRGFFGIPSFFSTSNIYKKIKTLSSIRQEEKINKVFCDLHLSQHKKFNNERSRVNLILNKEKNIDFLPYRINQEKIWEKYASYKFVISTFGNGLDCHRTWEALFLGAIVITKKSSLDPLYENLPVVIVEDWSDINEDNLSRWSNKYSHLTNIEYINKFYKYEYWLNK